MRKVPPPNPRLAMSVSHSSPPTVRWHPSHTNVCCWVPTSATPHWASNRKSHCPQISLWGSPVVLLQSFHHCALKLAATLRWVTGELEVLSQHDSAPTPCCKWAIRWSLTGFMDYILAFGLVCLPLAFWECVINGAQWAVNIRKMWILVHHKCM